MLALVVVDKWDRWSPIITIRIDYWIVELRMTCEEFFRFILIVD